MLVIRLFVVFCIVSSSYHLLFCFCCFVIFATRMEYKQRPEEPEIEGIKFSPYSGGDELAEIKRINDGLLSEAYSVYTYHYFVYEYPEISYVVRFHCYVTIVGKE